MIERATDPIIHNHILNQPEIGPHFGGGVIDVSEMLEYPDDYCLLHNGKDAASIWERTGPRIWQGHSLFLPSCRGKDAIREGKAMLAWMFDNLNARLLWGQTPIANRQARMFNRLCGLKSDGFGMHHVSGDVEYFTLER